MIVLEHTNPPTIYLDYHYWLPERGASGIMIGGEYYRYSDSGAFITCNPSPGGELGLGSPLTKNKSTFSDYHHEHNPVDHIVQASGGYWDVLSSCGAYSFNRYRPSDPMSYVCSRLSLFSALTTFSDYHYWNTSSWLLISAGVNGASGIFSTLLGGYESIPEICSRLSKN